jgi:hypothetical protein
VEDRNALLRLVSRVQALYFVPFSVWGLLHIRSFMWVTGKKQDVWLVKTVCLLLISVGSMIGQAGRKNRVTPEIAGLGISSSMSLAIIDVWYVAKGRIRWVYLLDAVGNAGLIAGWIAAWRSKGKTLSS